MDLMIGSDPELFVKRGGMYVSGHDLIPGNKLVPHPVKRGAVQVDGTALEFNIEPASCEDAFSLNISTVMGELRKMVPEYELVADPVAYFKKEYMERLPKDALELGCDPDYNAWSGEENVKPNASLPFRTGAGHVHIGWRRAVGIDVDHIKVGQRVSRQMDFFLALPSLLFDDDKQRREMYGKAGAYRPKEYGVEYRTLSNKWVGDDKLIRWVFRSTTKAMTELARGYDLSKKYGDIQSIINESDVTEAKKIIEAESLEVCHV